MTAEDAPSDINPREVISQALTFIAAAVIILVILVSCFNDVQARDDGEVEYEPARQARR